MKYREDAGQPASPEIFEMAKLYKFIKDNEIIIDQERGYYVFNININNNRISLWSPIIDGLDSGLKDFLCRLKDVNKKLENIILEADL